MHVSSFLEDIIPDYMHLPDVHTTVIDKVFRWLGTSNWEDVDEFMLMAQLRAELGLS